MNIPNDKSKAWRLNKFIDYHVFGDADMNFPLLVRYADEHELTQSQRYWLSFLYSTCYCVATTLVLYEKLDYKTITRAKLEKFWKKHKSKLIFQSDKRYVKNMNWFVTMVMNFITLTDRKPHKYFKQYRCKDKQETYNRLYKEIMSWPYYGRFTTFLMIEAIDRLTKTKADSNWFDWKNGNTATSGMMQIFHLDDEAIEFDNSKVLDKKVEAKLDRCLIKLKAKIAEKHPNALCNISDIETSLCGFRKLFKQSRYGGYYIDRVQAEIVTLQANYPKKQQLWDSLWRYRKEAFPKQYLGELNGWSGLRKELNSQWVREGLTGVEKIAGKHKRN